MGQLSRSQQELKEYFATGKNIPDQFAQPGEGAFMANMIKREKTRVLREFRGIPDDAEALAVVACALKPGETLGQFLSRTGLSIGQARNMTQAEILKFCQNADRVNEEQAVCAPNAWQPKRIPQKFRIDVAE